MIKFLSLGKRLRISCIVESISVFSGSFFAGFCVLLMQTFWFEANCFCNCQNWKRHFGAV